MLVKRETVMNIRIVLISVIFLTFCLGQPTTAQEEKEKIQWLSFKEAVKKSKKEKKKFFIDIYTSWCGWCKKMDKTTFRQPKIVEHINEHYYPVKIDAERKDTIHFDGRQFVFHKKAGRRGTHGLALSLLQGRPVYPSYVFLDQNFGYLRVLRGFHKPPYMDKTLRYITGEHYSDTTDTKELSKDKSFKKFMKNNKSDL